MCIIVASPVGSEIPSKKVLENCYNGNPDGFGFSYNHKGKVYIEKGYMDFEEGYKRLMEIDEQIGLKDKGVLMHYRISTSGLVDRGNTHPYSISNDMKQLRALKQVIDIAVVHNGIISKYIPDKGSKINDTQMFIKDYLYDIYQNDNEFLKDKKILSNIEKEVGSKLAFLDKDGNITFVGKFIEEEDGCYYSNSSYKEEDYFYCPIGFDEDFNLGDLTIYSGLVLDLTEFYEILGELYIVPDGEVIDLGFGYELIAQNAMYGIDSFSNVFCIDYNSYMIEFLGEIYYGNMLSE